MRGGTFPPYTNFEIEPLYAVSTPEKVAVALYGFVFLVRCRSNGVEK